MAHLYGNICSLARCSQCRRSTPGSGGRCILRQACRPSFWYWERLLIEKVYRNQAKNDLIFVLGESSYILYLIHPYVDLWFSPAYCRSDVAPGHVVDGDARAIPDLPSYGHCRDHTSMV